MQTRIVIELESELELVTKLQHKSNWVALQFKSEPINKWAALLQSRKSHFQLESEPVSQLI